MSILQKIRRSAEAHTRKAMYSPAPWLRAHSQQRSTVRLGTYYGGWHVVDTPRLRNGRAILCGAGEDISFDLALQAQFGAEILIADPTPRAVAHYEGVRKAASVGRTTSINNSAENYDLGSVDWSKVTFVPTAVWTETTMLQFWEPADPTHVSYSAVNLQGTQRCIEVPARSLGELAEQLGGVDLVKLDIEGAEGPVVRSILAGPLRPEQILLEFDEMAFPGRETAEGTKELVRELAVAGYDLAHFDGNANCTFLLR